MGWTETRFVLSCLLIYMCVMTAAVNDGVQTEDVRVEFGESATLRCTLLKPDTFDQVTWKKNGEVKGTTLATYTKGKGARVDDAHKDRLNISASDYNKTAITIYKADLEDEGCYLCVFNIFPEGAKKGKVCLSIPGEVLIEKSHQVKLGDATTLKCYLKNPENTTQVSWEKNGQTIGYYRDGKAKIEPQYQKTVSLKMESSRVSALTIQKATTGDEGEYKCVFNIFPTGSSDGKTKLYVHSLANCLQPEMLVMTLTVLSLLLWLYW